MIPEELKALSDRFMAFAEHECKSKSPLYYSFSKLVAEQEYLLQLASHCAPRQPAPNLLFGAIHYLLLKSPNEELANYYPSINKDAASDPSADLLISFCRENEAGIKEILAKRIVQTNALGRCSYLLPILSAIAKDTDGIHLIDIGTSSGLILNLDQYEYHYDGQHRIGNSPVKISANVKAGKAPGFEVMPNIKSRIGIDQNPLDLSKPDNALWLKALIWPDLKERFERMSAAIDLSTKLQNQQLIKANTIEQFRESIGTIPPEEDLLVFHTHVLYQFTKEERAAFRLMLDEVGQNRRLYYLAVEWFTVFDNNYEQEGVLVELNEYKAGEKSSKVLAIVDGHGSWIDWQ